MSEQRTDIARVTLGVLFIGGLTLASFWILRPFLPAFVWAVMIVVSTWPLLQRVERAVRVRAAGVEFADRLLHGTSAVYRSWPCVLVEPSSFLARRAPGSRSRRSSEEAQRRQGRGGPAKHKVSSGSWH